MTQALQVKRILVPVDGSDCSRYAAEQAMQIAQAYGAEMLFLHVVDAQVVEALLQRETDDDQRIRERLLENGQIYVRDIARLAEKLGLSYREQVSEGDPCTIICEAAAAADVDLIVMGKIGRHGARRILMGSISRRVIESTDRPVLIISAPPAA